MIRIDVIKEQRKPLSWVLTLCALFPVCRDVLYADSELEGLKNAIRSYLDSFTYTRRNSQQRLSVTHHIIEQDNTFTITTINDVPHVTIRLEKC